MKPSHRVFVNEFLRTGDQVKAYQKAYPHVSDNAARSAANRLLQDEEIAGFIDNVYDEVKEEVMAEFRDRMVELYDLKVYLSQMIRMEIWQEREVKSKDGTMILRNQPGFAQMLRAGHMMCVLEGWYNKSSENGSEERQTGADGRSSGQEEISVRMAGADNSSGLQDKLMKAGTGELRTEGGMSVEEMDRLRQELLRIGKAHEAYLQEIKDEAGILTYLFFVLDEEYGLDHLDETELLELQAEVEARLLNREQEAVSDDTAFLRAENKNKNIELLQHSATKTFAENSKPMICDFTTKPQKMIRIAMRIPE